MSADDLHRENLRIEKDLKMLANNFVQVEDEIKNLQQDRRMLYSKNVELFTENELLK